MFHCSEDVHDELDGTPDGTFLVRNSEKIGNYTLAVRKNGATELVRINTRPGGRCSFINISVNPPVLVEFPSIISFVEYFKEIRLTRFHSGLNVTLTHPHSRLMVRLNAVVSEVL